MKYAVMSDAHANPDALERALGDARRRGCTRFVFLGDVTGYGYDVKAVLSLVRRNFSVVVMGNHDSACVGLEPSLEVLVNPNYDLDRDEGRTLDAEERRYLKSLPLTASEGGLLFAHGDFIEPGAWNYVFSIRDAALNFHFRSDGIMFCGHTHHAAVWELTDKGMVRPRLERRFSSPALRNETSTIRIRAGSRYIVNVGSVGYPRNDRCASYAIYDDEAKSISMRRLSFDFKDYVAKMLDHGIRLPRWLFLPPAFA